MKRPLDICFDTKTIELFAAGAIDRPDERNRIEAHAAACALCRARIAEFGAYYRTAMGLPDSAVERTACLLLARIAPLPAARVLVLRPVMDRSARYTLAADGGRPSRYETVRRYANAEAEWIARVVRDNTNQELTLYLMAEGHGGFEDKVLEIDGISEGFSPDGEGRVRLMGFDEKRLGDRPIRLRSPMATFDLEPFVGLKERIVLEGRFELSSAEFDRIQIEAEEEAGKTVYRIRIVKLKGDPDVQNVHVVVSRKAEPSVASRAQRGVAVFENLDLENVLTIRIY